MHLPFIPINAKRVACPFRLPKGVRNHSDAGGHCHDLAHAWHSAGVRIIEALHLCAKDRRAAAPALRYCSNPDHMLELPPVICIPKTGWLYFGSTGADSYAILFQSASSSSASNIGKAV